MLQQHRKVTSGLASNLSTNGVGSLPHSDDENLWNQKAVIIVGSLLFFIIFTLALIPLAKCAIRVMNWESLREVENRLANTGLKHRVVHSFPVIVFERPSFESAVISRSLPLSDIASSQRDISSFPSSLDCPICLAQFERGDKIRLLPTCFHGFHVNCIDTWLLGHSSCPICRHNLLSYQLHR
ncbi:hypothetical protein L7F22_048339 [Adiantum nelumboides]|nr:hypothetical protein [Adiantum nelumboides]